MIQRMKQSTENEGEQEVGMKEDNEDNEDKTDVEAKLPEPVSEQEELASRLELLGLKDMSQFTA